MLAAGPAPAFPSLAAPEPAYAEGAANSTVTITHQPVGGTFAKSASLRLYVRAYSPDNHLLSYAWYESPDDSNATLDNDTLIDGCDSPSLSAKTHGSAGETYYYAVVTDTATRATAKSDPAKVTVVDLSVYDGAASARAANDKRPLWTKLENGGFEDREGAVRTSWDSRGVGLYSFFPGWQTTEVDGIIESGLYPLYFSNTSANSNVDKLTDPHCAELTADNVSSLYQEIATEPGKIYEWQLDHKPRPRNVSGRENYDIMAVVIGPAVLGASDYSGYTNAKPYGTNDKGYLNDVVDHLAQETLGDPNVEAAALVGYAGRDLATTYQGKTYYVSIVKSSALDPNNPSKYNTTSWVHHSGSYTVPEGQGTTVFGFVSVYSREQKAGNVLDNIVFAAGTGIDISNDVDYSGGGVLSVDVADAEFRYGLLEVRGSTAFAAQGARAVQVDSVLTADENGWYTPEAAGVPITFSGLTPGKTYRVVAIPAGAINEGLGANLVPASVLDESYYRQVTVKPVADSSDGAGGNIQATAQKVGSSASIIVRPARADVEYALVEANAAGTGAASPVVPAKDKGGVEIPWSTPASGESSLAFSNLALGRSYVIVARPKGYDEIGHADQVAAGSFVVVKTPSENFVDVSPDDGSVVRASGEASDSITVTNKSTQTQRYLVYDAATGAATDGVWHELQPNTTDAWPGLDSTGVYQVVAAEPSTAAGAPGSAPSPGVRAYPAAPDPEIDYAAETVGKGGIVPKAVEFRLKDNGTGEYYRGTADSWEQGTGGSPVSLTDYLDKMTPGGLGATLSYRTHADYEPAVYVEKSVTVPARPAAPELGASGYAFDYASEGIAPGADVSGDVQVRASSDAEWERGAAGSPVPLADLGWTGVEKTVQVRMAAVAGTSFASAANASANVPARSLPPDVSLLSEDNGQTYSFSGPDADACQYREYNSAGEGDWADCANASPAKGKTYEVRKAAGLDEFASNIVLRSSSEAQLEAAPGAFEDAVYGYADAPTALLALTNPGKSTAAVDAPNAEADPSVAIIMTRSPQSYQDKHGASPAFSVAGTSARVAASGVGAEADPTASTPIEWTIKASEGLPAGTYEARITVAYSDGGESGDESVYYTAMGTVSLVVTKATPALPSLSLVGVTDTTAHLSASSNDPHPVSIEYSTAASWGYGDSSTLTGLSPATCYEFYARTAADANHNASQPAMVRACTAHAAPDADAVKFDFAAETVSFPAGCELRAAASEAGAEVASGSSVTDYVGSSLYLRLKAAGDGAVLEDYVPASDWTSVTVPARPSIAASTTVVNAADSRNPDGKVTVSGVAEFQYRKLSDAGWTRVQGASMALPAGAYEVRVPATGSAFASVPLPFTITANNYFATFDLAGGVDAMGAAAEQYVASGGAASRPSTDPTREGYDFAGWHAVSPDGTVADADWNFGAALTSDVTLAAKWTANTYTVAFDANGGTGGPMTAQSFTYDEMQELSTCTYTREGYLFKGWSPTADGTAEDPGAQPEVAYTDGQPVKNLTSENGEAVTLYAVWARPAISAAVPISATVVVDANGNFTCPGAYDSAKPEAGGYCISSTTPAALKVESVSFKLAEGADGIFPNATDVTAAVNGLELKAGDVDKATASYATEFKLKAAREGETVYLPLALELFRPGGTMTYSKEARPFATLTYKLAFDDEAAASGEGA